MNIQNIFSYKEDKFKFILLLTIISLLFIGITIALSKRVTTESTPDNFIATVMLPDEKAVLPWDLSAEIKTEWQGLTADQIIGRYKKGHIRREFPKQFLDETIEVIEEVAKTGDRMARKAMKLLTNKRFDKDDNNQ